jgi:hypothetical protein
VASMGSGSGMVEVHYMSCTNLHLHVHCTLCTK